MSDLLLLLKVWAVAIVVVGSATFEISSAYERRVKTHSSLRPPSTWLPKDHR